MRPRAVLCISLGLAVLLGVHTGAHAHGSLHQQITALTHEITARADDAALYLRRGELYRLHRDWVAAGADYDAAARLDPVGVEVHRCRGALWLDAGDAARALESLDAFLLSRPEDAAARLLRARTLRALGRTADAIVDYDRSIATRRDPRPEHYLERARWLQESGRTAAARAGLEAGMARLGSIAALENAKRELESGAATRADAARLAHIEAPVTQAAVEVVPDLETPAAAGTSLLLSARPPQLAAATLLPRNATWRYLAGPTDPSTSWQGVLYDDSVWPSGPGVLGFGEPYITTLVPWGSNPNNRYTTTYFRSTFVLNEDPATLQSLTLLANYDDGFIAYLNGVEVARRGLIAGTVSYGTFALSHEGGGYEAIDLTAFTNLMVQGSNVVAVEVHQTSLNSSDLVWDAEIFHGLRLTRGPYLQMATPTGVVVRWRTSTPTNSRVLYGKMPGALVSMQDDATLTTEHEVLLAGFFPDTRTYYSVGTTDEVLAGDDAEYYFETAPPPGTSKPTRIWVLGDSGLIGAAQNAVRDAFDTYAGGVAPDVWLMLGDNAYIAGTDAEYQGALFEPYKNQLRRCALWLTRGNHDLVYAGANDDYYDMFSLPSAGQAGGLPSGTEAYYAFDYGNIHFVCLDSEGTDRSPGGAMMTWLAADLATNGSDWRIAFWHHPPYTKGSHDSDNDFDSAGRMRDMRANALPILDSLGVDLVLNGHSHSYERSFLLDGHYGPSSTLTPAMKLDPGDGRPGSPTGAYTKENTGAAPHEGAVYAVAGSSSQTSGGFLNHPAMFTSMNVLGSMVLDVHDHELIARFLDHTGAVRDYFAIVKGPGGTPVGIESEPRITLRLEAMQPNPFRGFLRVTYSIPRAGAVRLTVHDAAGRRVTTLVAGAQRPGRHTIAWDGHDAHGRQAAPGVYFGRLEFDGTSRQGKIVLMR